jgi:hypothetical protein
MQPESTNLLTVRRVLDRRWVRDKQGSEVAGEIHLAVCQTHSGATPLQQRDLFRLGSAGQQSWHVRHLKTCSLEACQAVLDNPIISRQAANGLHAVVGGSLYCSHK